MDISSAQLRTLYETMVLARRFDEAMIRIYSAGEIYVEAVHSYAGQEAIGVGAGSALQRGDFLIPSFRSRPAFFALKIPLELQWAGILSRRASPGQGLAESRHMTAMEYGVIGTTGILASHIPVATGVGMGLKALRRGGAAVCLFGDGATNRGDFHEGLNMASLFKVPVVFVCEANGVAESQPSETYLPVADLSVRALSYGIPGVRCDGNDVGAVYAAVEGALERARGGGGPSLIVCETYRLRAHVEGLLDFRSKELLAEWRRRDPLLLAAAKLAAVGELTDAERDGISAAADSAIEKALAWALDSPVLDPTVLPSLVYASGPSV